MAAKLSPKTSFGGILVGIGSLISALWPEYDKLGLAIAGIGGTLAGVAARDNNKTSEDVGAKPKPIVAPEATVIINPLQEPPTK